ncbi:MAG: carbamate kinase, partial [Candidatus Heimdallarchaeota archaeon]|nr:carbamate kinase [Candidatus Heimdallarchaeota archaeon]
MLIVIAIGGNMISDASNKTETFEQQLSRVNSTAELISKIIQMGHDVVITHGNGPQVGSLLLQQEEGIDGTIKLPLSVLTACTQGLIGVMLQHALSNQFRNDGIEKNVLIIPATMIVDKSDPAFSNPTKPVGPYFNITDLYESGLKSDGKYQEFPQGYRKVVPSPIPTDILELPIIDSLL